MCIRDRHATPAGVYSILYTEPDSKLIGEKDPETGKPIYETYVRYWMPFTYQGHGFHDADWQTAFGGSTYQSYGSHGCVNTVSYTHLLKAVRESMNLNRKNLVHRIFL